MANRTRQVQRIVCTTFLSFLLLCFSMSDLVAQVSISTELLQYTASSVVQVNGEVPGSGFFVSHEGDIFTACHVITEDKDNCTSEMVPSISIVPASFSQEQLEIRRIPLGQDDGLFAEVVYADPELDFAHLRLIDEMTPESSSWIPPTRWATSHQGDSLFYVGLGTNEDFLIHPPATVQSFSGNEYEIVSSLEDGNSGGPLVQSEGYATGIALTTQVSGALSNVLSIQAVCSSEDLQNSDDVWLQEACATFEMLVGPWTVSSGAIANLCQDTDLPVSYGSMINHLADGGTDHINVVNLLRRLDERMLSANWQYTLDQRGQIDLGILGDHTTGKLYQTDGQIVQVDYRCVSVNNNRIEIVGSLIYSGNWLLTNWGDSGEVSAITNGDGRPDTPRTPQATLSFSVQGTLNGLLTITPQQ
ncbi:MAG: serine protease, partial [Chloroflexota bacterium]